MLKQIRNYTLNSSYIKSESLSVNVDIGDTLHILSVYYKLDSGKLKLKSVHTCNYALKLDKKEDVKSILEGLNSKVTRRYKVQ